MLPKILVVDDCKSVRVSVERLLADAGYQVITAADGFEAIEKLEHSPDLLILDIQMPGLDGYGVCEKLQEMGSQWEKIPVVFLTSIKSKALEFLGDQYGAYLHKPVIDRQLISVVEETLAELI